MNKIKFVKQHDENDCGVACIKMMSDYFGNKMEYSYIREQLHADVNGVNMYDIVKFCNSSQMSCKALNGNIIELKKAIYDKDVKLPCIAHLIKENGWNHYVIIIEYKSNEFHIMDPAKGYIKMPEDCFSQEYSGNIICYENVKKAFFSMSYNEDGLNKFIGNMVMDNKRTIMLMMVLTLILSFSNIYFAFVLESFISRKITSTIIKNNIIIFICIFVVYIFSYVKKSYVLIDFEKKLRKKIIEKFYFCILDGTQLEVMRYTENAYITRYSELDYLIEYITSCINIISSEVFMIIIMIIILGSLNVKLLIINISMMLFLYAIMKAKAPILGVLQQNISEDNSKMIKILKEIFQGFRVIKNYNVTALRKYYINRVVDKYNEDLCLYEKNTILIDATSQCFFMLFQLITIVVSLILVKKDIWGIGSAIVYYYIFTNILPSLSNVMDTLIQHPKVETLYDRFKDVAKIKTETQSCSEEMEVADNILECKRISYSYDYKKIFNEFDFFVQKHEIVGLYGSNGSGKSTFANILTRNNEKFEGTVKFQGVDIARINRTELRSHILLVSSDDFIFEDSIYNNICLGEMFEEDKVYDVCYKCGIVPSITNDLNDVIMSNGANLSTGQRK